MVTGYKQTELGIIPNDWNVELLGNIASPKARIGWQNLRKDEFLDSGDFMLITGTDFENGKINYKICKYVSKERYLQDENIQVKNGDILITKDGTLGKVAFVQELHMPATLNAGVFVLTGLSNEVNNRFLYQYLCTEKLMKYAEKTSTGGTIQHLNQGVLVNFPIPIPPLKEQKRIAQSLFDMDTLIAKSEQAIKKYRALKQTCLQHMFPRAGQTEPDIRLPGFTGPWEQRKLGELATFNKGAGYSKSDLKASGTQIILYGRLYTKYETVIKQVDTFVDSRPGSVYSEGGEVIVPASGETAEDIAIASVVEKPGILLGGDLNIIHPIRNLDSTFLAISISNGEPHKEMAKRAQGKSVVHLHNDDLSQIKFRYPSIEEQSKISKFFSNLDNLITLHQRTCEKYKKIKQGMMEELLSGKIRLV